MSCIACQSTQLTTLKGKTCFGYEQYRCCSCNKQFNERTGAPFNFIEYPTEVDMIVIHYYYRFKTSLDDVVELMALRGFNLCIKRFTTGFNVLVWSSV